MSMPNCHILHQARRALEARKNQNVQELASTSVPALRDRLANVHDAQTWIKGPDWNVIARWNGTFSSDILYEWRAEKLFANVLFAKDSPAEGSEDVYHYVQLVRSDSNPDEWLYVQTVTANADTLATSSSRLRPSIELAKQAYNERQSRRAAKQQERGQQLMFLAPTGNVHKAPSVHSGSEAGGSFVSDSDDDDGVFSPMPVMSPLLARRNEPHSSQEYGQLRRERLAMEKLRQTIQGIYSLSEMMGLTREQFMACVQDVVLENEITSLHL